MPTHAPDTEPDQACPPRHRPAGRYCMGRPSPEHRPRLTSGRSPVRESRTPGSARGAGGNSRPYRDIHTGPEPCVGPREGSGEASAGERAGWPLSRERATVPGADVVTVTEGHTSGGVSASLRRPGVVRDPSMHGRSLSGNREISRPTRGSPRVRIGKVRSRSR
jgi:hypothetical protein